MALSIPFYSNSSSALLRIITFLQVVLMLFLNEKLIVILVCFWHRSEVPPSTATHDCTGHPAIPQHSENLELNTPRATCLYIYFGVAHGGRYYTFGE